MPQPRKWSRRRTTCSSTGSLNRQGLKHWSHALDNGLSRVEFVRAVLASTEFRQQMASVEDLTKYRDIDLDHPGRLASVPRAGVGCIARAASPVAPVLGAARHAAPQAAPPAISRLHGRRCEPRLFHGPDRTARRARDRVRARREQSRVLRRQHRTQRLDQRRLAQDAACGATTACCRSRAIRRA